MSKIIKTLILISIMFLGIITNGYAKSFDSPCFNISLDNIKLISKTEEKAGGFYRYVFASSNDDDADQQMRVIVSDKKPEAEQSLEEFQLESIGAISTMFIDSYKLYEYLGTPENKKVLSEKPYKLKAGDITFSGATMYFGNIDASFLVTRSHNMTYAFTLISDNSNKETRKNNLNSLTKQLQSIKFKSCL